jgi:hypothetical protein
MLRVKLTHSSHVAGSEGSQGDIVEASEAQAKDWLANGGAVLVTEEELAPKPEPEKPKQADGMRKRNREKRGGANEVT